LHMLKLVERPHGFPSISSRGNQRFRGAKRLQFPHNPKFLALTSIYKLALFFTLFPLFLLFCAPVCLSIHSGGFHFALLPYPDPFFPPPSMTLDYSDRPGTLFHNYLLLSPVSRTFLYVFFSFSEVLRCKDLQRLSAMVGPVSSLLRTRFWGRFLPRLRCFIITLVLYLSLVFSFFFLVVALRFYLVRAPLLVVSLVGFQSVVLQNIFLFDFSFPPLVCYPATPFSVSSRFRGGKSPPSRICSYIPLSFHPFPVSTPPLVPSSSPQCAPFAGFPLSDRLFRAHLKLHCYFDFLSSRSSHLSVSLTLPTCFLLLPFATSLPSPLFPLPQ